MGTYFGDAAVSETSFSLRPASKRSTKNSLAAFGTPVDIRMHPCFFAKANYEDDVVSSVDVDDGFFAGLVYVRRG